MASKYQIGLKQAQSEIQKLRREIKTLQNDIRAIQKVVNISGGKVSIQSKGILDLNGAIVRINGSQSVTKNSKLVLIIKANQLIGVGYMGVLVKTVGTPLSNVTIQ